MLLQITKRKYTIYTYSFIYLFSLLVCDPIQVRRCILLVLPLRPRFALGSLFLQARCISCRCHAKRCRSSATFWEFTIDVTRVWPCWHGGVLLGCGCHLSTSLFLETSSTQAVGKAGGFVNYGMLVIRGRSRTDIFWRCN